MNSTPLYRSRPSGFEIQPASQPEARKVYDFIYLSEGLSNSYLITTPEGRIVVNTGMGFEAPVHKRNFDAVDGSPVRYILLTQGHVDHVGGVDLFREEGTQLVAQANNEPHQTDDGRIAAFRASRSAFAFADAIARAWTYIQENVGGGIPAQSRPTPDITFEEHLSLELGGVRMELYSTPGGETTDSMVIWLPDHKVCFCGNLFSALFGHFPNLVTVRGDRYREALGFIESLERVRALEPELLLTGHHGPVVGKETIRAELTRLRDAVRFVHDETVRGMNHGKDIHTLMREIQLPPELEVGEGLREGLVERARDLGELRGVVPPQLDDGAVLGACERACTMIWSSLPAERIPSRTRARDRLSSRRAAGSDSPCRGRSQRFACQRR